MKVRFLVSIFLILLIGFRSNAQNTKPIVAEWNNGELVAKHEVKNGETLYTIAQMYSVPAVVLSQKNDISFYEKLEEGRIIYTTLGNYNYLTDASCKSCKQLIYKAKDGDTYSELSKKAKLNLDLLKNLNKELAEIKSGNEISIGWIQYISNEPIVKPIDIPKVSNKVITKNEDSLLKKPKIEVDTAIGTPSDFENIFKYQTSNEQYLDSTEGMVVFFKPQTVVNEGMLYAFSDDIAKGRVVKVLNPSNMHYVLAKVIGRLPKTKQYLNAKFGLDGRARDMLETREIKLWCTLILKY